MIPEMMKSRAVVVYCKVVCDKGDKPLEVEIDGLKNKAPRQSKGYE
jgi:hypothetical protein